MHVLGCHTFAQARAAAHTPESLALLRQLREEWRELLQPGEETGIGFLPGSRESSPSAVRPTVPQDEWEQLHAVYGKLSEGTRQLIKHCLRLADHHRVDLTWLARHITQWDNYVKEAQEEGAWFEREMLAEEERQRLKEENRARRRREIQEHGMTTEQVKFGMRKRKRYGGGPDGEAY
jgi:hypothetical protein